MQPFIINAFNIYTFTFDKCMLYKNIYLYLFICDDLFSLKKQCLCQSLPISR